MNKYKADLRFIFRLFLTNAVLFYVAGFQYLHHIFTSETLFATTFHSYESLWGIFLVVSVNLCSYFGHFSLLAFLPCLILIPCIFMLPRIVILLLAIGLWSIALLGLFADNIVFSLFHFHINMPLLKILFNKDYSFAQFLEISQLEITLGIIVCLLTVAMESAIAWFFWKKNNKPTALPVRKIIFSQVACLYISYMGFMITTANFNNVFALQTPSLPLYNNILAMVLPFKESFAYVTNASETRFSQSLFPIGKLDYPLHPLQCAAQSAAKNIIIIGIDTLRFDSINSALMPHIYKFAQNAWQFTNHDSGGNVTQSGLFSLFYGLPVNYWESMREQNQGPVLIDELLKQGYEAKIFFSSIMIPPFHKTVFNKIKNLRIVPAPGETIPDHDRSITKEFAEFVHQRNPNQPFFAFLFYDAAHGYMLEQNIPKVYKGSTSASQRFLHNDVKILSNRYKNALNFIDNEVDKVLTVLANRKLLDNSIVIITGDHGEEFDDNHKGFLGHGSNYSSYQIQVPFVVKWPSAKSHIYSRQTSHYDLAPTLLHNVLGCKNVAEDYSIGKDLFDKNTANFLLVGSYINSAIIQRNKITTLLNTGNIQITDEKLNPLWDTKIDPAVLEQALVFMRKYYQHRG